MTEEQIEKMRRFVTYYATCPCCDKSDVCVDGCTFSEDDPTDLLVMQWARESLGVKP